MKAKELSVKIKGKALDQGFAVAGIASIPGSSRIKLRTKALERWLDKNYHSDMKWMEAERRKNIDFLLEGARSIVCVGFNYLSGEQQNRTKLKIGKFSQGEDYHKVIKRKLIVIGKWLESEIPDCKWKICVDTSPLLEKAWAEESGLGWIGKHSNLINEKYGSWLSLGFLILNTELSPDKPSKALCGQCEKCITQCPTEAIVEPFVIKADRCIAYHTIENRNKTIPNSIKTKLNGWIAGCDICQDICPWNKSSPENHSIEAMPKEWMININEESLTWNDEEWTKRLQGTTLKRMKPWMWRRNIKAALQNQNDFK